MIKKVRKINRYLPYSRQKLDRLDIGEVAKVLKSNFITQGPEILNFEKNFSKYVGAKFAAVCATGTAALHLSCMALGIKKNDNVATSSITFVASANCSEFVGANTHFIDIDKDTYCISPESLEKELKKRKINLVIVVHLCGHSADMKKIYQLKKKYKFFIIEDACHALGGSYENKKIGSCEYSDLSTFSFHPVKPITSGEGGMITTNNKKLFEKIINLRTHGIHKNSNTFMNKKLAFDKNGQVNRWYYEMSDLGYNYRITDIQAALGNSQLKKVNKFTDKRIQIAKLYNRGFKSNNLIKTPIIKKNVKHAFHLYTLLINFKKLSKTRNEVMSKLANLKIGTQVLYIPVFLQPYYANKYNYKSSNFQNAIRYYENALSIPIFPDLKKKEINFVISKINEIVKI